MVVQAAHLQGALLEQYASSAQHRSPTCLGHHAVTVVIVISMVIDPIFVPSPCMCVCVFSGRMGMHVEAQVSFLTSHAPVSEDKISHWPEAPNKLNWGVMRPRSLPIQ